MAQNDAKTTPILPEFDMDKLVKKEKNRLKRIYKDMPKDRMSVAEGLLDQAARLRVSLDILWTDISTNGDTEMFSQSEKTEPYERERPAARLYNSRNREYTNVIKQLDGMLPQAPPTPKGDGFDDFVERRDD